MNMVKFFWIPSEVCYYVVFPIVLILFIYFMFNLFYKKKKGTYYYNYVVDYVYCTLGIVFCGLLFCLLLGYSIATFQILITNGAVKNYILLDIILVILPIIPSCFFVYIIKIYLKNLKRKEILDANLNLQESNNNIERNNDKNELNSNYEYVNVELRKKRK